MLEISLFGSFDLKRDSVSVRTTWTRQAHRLLALLTLNHARPVKTLWNIDAILIPDAVLPHSLGELYDAFGQDRSRLTHKNHQIHFDTSGVSVDLFEFDWLIGRGTPDCLAQATKLHRGGLLKDWEEEGWFCEERENSLADYLEAINSLTKSALACHDYDLAACYLRRYVNAYPEMDAAWSRLAEVYAAAGNTLDIEQTREKYLKSLDIRSKAEGRVLAPSQRFVQACAGANPNLRARAEISPDLSHAILLDAAARREPGERDRNTPSPNLSHDGERDHNTQNPIPISEPVGGAVPADSPFYIAREADKKALEALARRDSFVLVKGARQVGKSSLLARLIAAARLSGSQVVRTDWQKLSQSALVTDRAFLLELAETFVDHLELDASPSAYFESPRGGAACFERFLKKEVLANITGHLVWVVDEADRLFEQPYRDDVFAMLRSWHGERAVDHTGRWQKLTVVIAYATEAYLFITNMDQSPFNIGTKLELDDFTQGQVEQLNVRYGSPLKTEDDRSALYDLIGGHPYLVRRALQKMSMDGTTLEELTESASNGHNIFNDHLVRMKLAIQRDPAMEAAVKQYLSDGSAPDPGAFLRLRAAGVMRGNSAASMRPRCLLYDQYLRGNLQ